MANKVNELMATRKSAKILDIGCGDGLVADSLKERGFSDMVGLDISEKMVQLARAKNVYTEVLQADLMRPIPLPCSSYDVLTCVGVTTYLEPWVIVEWCKMVKPGKNRYFPLTAGLFLSCLWFRWILGVYCEVWCAGKMEEISG